MSLTEADEDKEQVVEDLPPPQPAGGLVEQVGVTIFLMLIGVGFTVGGVSYGVGSIAKPGSGFVPIVVGISMILFGALLLYQELTGRSEHSDLEQIEGEKHVLDEDGANPADGAGASERRTSRTNGLFSVLICLAVFGLVLIGTELLGLLVTTAIAVGVLAFVMKTSWWASIVVAGGFYLFGYLVFAMWLEIPLPFGTITGG